MKRLLSLSRRFGLSKRTIGQGVMTTDHHCVDHNVPGPVPGAGCGSEADTCAAIHRSGWQMRGWRKPRGLWEHRGASEGDSRALSEATPCQSPRSNMKSQFDLEAAVRLKGADVTAGSSLGCILADQLGDLGKIRCSHHVRCSCEMWQLLALELLRSFQPQASVKSWRRTAQLSLQERACETSLVVQWLDSALPMQGTQVRELDPTHS